MEKMNSAPADDSSSLKEKATALVLAGAVLIGGVVAPERAEAVSDTQKDTRDKVQEIKAGVSLDFSKEPAMYITPPTLKAHYENIESLWDDEGIRELYNLFIQAGVTEYYEAGYTDFLDGVAMILAWDFEDNRTLFYCITSYFAELDMDTETPSNTLAEWKQKIDTKNEHYKNLLDAFKKIWEKRQGQSELEKLTK